MGLIDRFGKKILLKLPDLKLISLARESMPYISVSADGLSFLFKNTDHSILDYMVVNNKIWSKEEMDFILGYYKSISKKPGNLIDIGANIGTSIIYFRDRIGEDCSFYAVEPVTENYKLLKTNCELNGFGDIKSFRIGISDTEGEADMEINPGNMATCRIAGTDDNGLVFKKDDDSYVGDKVSLLTLDHFVSDKEIDLGLPLLFWIDVEGHEPEVFKSGKNTFRNSDSVVYCEFNPKLYKSNGSYDGFINDMKECFTKFLCFENSAPDEYVFRSIEEIDKIAAENNMNQCDLLLVK